MESARRDEKYVVSLYRSVFCVDDAAFDYRQNVALNAFAGNIRPVG